MKTDNMHVVTLFKPCDLYGKQVHGVRWNGSWEQFCDLAVWNSKTPVMDKHDGGFYAPSCLLENLRDHEALVSLSMIVLDADKGVDWTRWRDYLDLHGFNYVLYETPSSTEGDARWRCVLPLKEYYLFDAPQKYEQWKLNYAHILKYFGKIAGLDFDKSLQCPSNPVFWGRRSKWNDYRKVVYCTTGAPLDLNPLLVGCPKVKPSDIVLVKADVPAGEALQVAKKWIASHPCPARGLGLYHSYCWSIANALINGCGLDTATATTLILPVTGDNQEARAAIDSASRSTHGKGWLVGARTRQQSAEDFAKEVETYLEDTPFKTFTLGEKTGISRMDTDRGRNRPGKKTMAERRADAAKRQGSVPPELSRAAWAAIDQAKKWRKLFKQVFESQGLKEQPRHSCGFEQALADASEARAIGTASRPCNVLSCPSCGPRLVAQHASVALMMPPVVKDEDGKHIIIGTPMGSRADLYRWVLTNDKGVENLKRTFRRRFSNYLKSLDVSVLPLPCISNSSIDEKRTSKADTPPLYLLLRTPQGTIVYCTDDLSNGASAEVLHPTSVEVDGDGDTLTRRNPDFETRYLEDMTSAVVIRDTLSVFDVINDSEGTNDVASLAPKTVTFGASTPHHLPMDPQTLIRWAQGNTSYALSDADDDVSDQETTHGILQTFGASKIRQVVDGDTETPIFTGGLVPLENWDEAATAICKKRVNTSVWEDDGVATLFEPATLTEADRLSQQALEDVFGDWLDDYPHSSLDALVLARLKELEK